MKLSMILAQARSGELSSLSTLDKTDAKVITYINLALVALYSRFTLVTEEAIVKLRPDLVKTVYSLDGTDSDVTVRNAPVPAGDVLSIVAAFNEDGTQVALNDDGDPFSIYTVSYNQVQVPLLADKAYVSIIYKKAPTLVSFVDDGTGSAADVDVGIPLVLLDPMLHYIGYRAHGAVDGNVNAENSTHYTRYLAACADVLAQGMLAPEATTHLAFKKRGFV